MDIKNIYTKAPSFLIFLREADHISYLRKDLRPNVKGDRMKWTFIAAGKRWHCYYNIYDGIKMKAIEEEFALY